MAALAVTPVILSSTVIACDPDDRSLSAKGDAEKGKRIYNQCRACHQLTEAPTHRMGPNLGGLFGRKAGSAEGYEKRYSPALKNADFTWNEHKLAEWLKNPKSFLPGNRMTFMGLRKEQQIYDILAYLREATAVDKK